MLDTGALIAVERGGDKWRALLRRLIERDVELAIPSGVLAQAWRGTARQARLGRFLSDRRIVHVPLDPVMARASGELLGRAGSDDAVDASVVTCAMRLGALLVVTSDPVDLLSLNPKLPVEVI